MATLQSLRPAYTVRYLIRSICVIMAASDVEYWVAWEPAEWVDKRGPSLYHESEHFVCRYGSNRHAEQVER